MALVNELREQGNYLFKHRGTLPVLILVPALLVRYLQGSNGDTDDGNWVEIIQFAALGISLLGLLIRCHAVGYAASNTSGRNTHTGQKADQLNSSGLYSVVRHPLYLGNFLMWLGPALLTMNFWFVFTFILLFYLYYERIMFAEERFLEEKFGDDYLKWAGGRPAFIPKLKGYIPAVGNFNWRRILRQERSGFLATFFVFWLFYLVGNIREDYSLAFTLNFWSISFILALIVFLILKLMKRSEFLKDRE